MKYFNIVLILTLAFLGCTTEPALKTWTLTLDLNGGAGINKTSYTVNDGDSQELTETATRTGYTFVNWNTKADGSGTEFKSGVTTVTSDLTIYAIWKANSYTVTFKQDTGDIVNTFSYGDALAMPSGLLEYEYRRITATSNLEKSVWTDQDKNVFASSQKVTQNLIFTQSWQTATIPQFVNDIIGVWTPQDKTRVYIIEKNSSDANAIDMYSCYKTPSDAFSDSEIAALTKTSAVCNSYPASGSPFTEPAYDGRLFSWSADSITYYKKDILKISYITTELYRKK